MTCIKKFTIWSAIFSLNFAVAEPSRRESESQANLAVYTNENVIRGSEDLLSAGKEPESKTNLIDGLLIKKVFLIAQNSLFILVNQTSLLRQECLLLITLHDGIWN